MSLCCQEYQETIAEKEAEIETLKIICAQAYQVVGILSDECSRFCDEQVIKMLDNLSEQKMIHEDVLPFETKVACKQPNYCTCVSSSVCKQQNDVICRYSLYQVVCDDPNYIARNTNEIHNKEGYVMNPNDNSKKNCVFQHHSPEPESEWIHLKRYGYAPGRYTCKCADCGKFVDWCDKRALICRQCADKRYIDDSCMYSQDQPDTPITYPGTCRGDWKQPGAPTDDWAYEDEHTAPANLVLVGYLVTRPIDQGMSSHTEFSLEPGKDGIDGTEPVYRKKNPFEHAESLFLSDEEVDECWDGLLPGGYGKSRYDIARLIVEASTRKRMP